MIELVGKTILPPTGTLAANTARNEVAKTIRLAIMRAIIPRFRSMVNSSSQKLSTSSHCWLRRVRQSCDRLWPSISSNHSTPAALVTQMLPSCHSNYWEKQLEHSGITESSQDTVAVFKLEALVKFLLWVISAAARTHGMLHSQTVLPHSSRFGPNQYMAHTMNGLVISTDSESSFF